MIGAVGTPLPFRIALAGLSWRERADRGWSPRFGRFPPAFVFDHFFPSSLGASMHWLLQSLVVVSIGFAFGDSKPIEQRDESGVLRMKREVHDDGHGNQIRQGYETHYFSDGTESSKYRYQDDDLDGPWHEWYAGGKVKAEGNYRKGEKDGIEIHLLPTGEKIQQTEYKNGRRNGKKLEWSSTTHQKTLDADYIDDQLNGKLQIWYSDGTPRALSNFVHGQEDGVQQTWHENGKLASQIEFHDGQKSGSAREWYATGQIRMQSRYHNGGLQGMLTQWYPDGAKRSEVSFVDNEKQGTLTQWYDSTDKQQVVSLIENYEHGRKNGVQATYYESGKKLLQVTSRDGERQGPWAEWYETGQVKSKGVYKDDQLDGPVWFYYEDGKQWAINCYSKGTRNGRWAELDRDGKLVRDQYYSQGVLVSDEIKKAEAKAKEAAAAKN
jgi:antitoxin component YwqK of YwqJK toxin-antitoxin module